MITLISENELVLSIDIEYSEYFSRILSMSFVGNPCELNQVYDIFFNHQPLGIYLALPFSDLSSDVR